MLQMLKRNLTECDSQQTPLFFYNIIICHNSDDGGGFLDFGGIVALLQVLIKHSACPGTWSYCLRNELELRKFILSGQPVIGASEIFHWICVFFNCSDLKALHRFPFIRTSAWLSEVRSTARIRSRPCARRLCRFHT